MFLRQQHKERPLFVTLPNKQDFIMSPASKQPSKIADEVDFEDCTKEDKFLRTSQREIGMNFHERLSKLLLVTKNENKSKLLKANREYDSFITFEKSIGSYQEIKNHGIKQEVALLHVENDDRRSEIETNTNLKGDEKSLSPGRLSSPEKKSVRFVDEVMGKRASLEDSAKDSNIDNEKESLTLQDLSPNGITCEKTESQPNNITNQKSPTSILRTAMSENSFHERCDRIFGKTKDFRCHECEKSFKYRSNLKTHVLSVHNGAMWKSSGTIVFNSTDDILVCDVCSQFFKYPVNLRAHKAGHVRSKLSSTI